MVKASKYLTANRYVCVCEEAFLSQGQLLPGMRNNKDVTNQQSIFTFLVKIFLVYKMNPLDTML